MREFVKQALICALARVLAYVALRLLASCGDNWPKAIEIGVSIGRDASNTACYDVAGDTQVDCPDAGTD